MKRRGEDRGKNISVFPLQPYWKGGEGKKRRERWRSEGGGGKRGGRLALFPFYVTKGGERRKKKDSQISAGGERKRKKKSHFPIFHQSPSTS